MTTEKSLVAEAENPQHQPQKEEGEGATSSGQQETQLEEASETAAEGDNQCEQKLKTSNGDTPTHEDLTKNKERTSENRGLSRLFSSFLKRPKSQVSEEEGKEVESAKEKGEGGQKEINEGDRESCSRWEVSHQQAQYLEQIILLVSKDDNTQKQSYG